MKRNSMWTLMLLLPLSLSSGCVAPGERGLVVIDRSPQTLCDHGLRKLRRGLTQSELEARMPTACTAFPIGTVVARYRCLEQTPADQVGQVCAPLGM